MELIYHDFQSGLSPMWKKLLEMFGEERGIATRYVTAPQPMYEKALAENLSGDTPPAVMRVRFGLLQKYGFLKDLFEPLNDMKAAKEINRKYCAVNKNGDIVSLAYNCESIGLVYNKKIMERYFALADRKNREINSVSDIKSQKTLILVADDIHAHRNELGIEGTFPTAAFAPNSDFQWRKYAMSMPLFYEMRDRNTENISDFAFDYAENTRLMFDMFFRNCTGSVDSFGSTLLNDSVGTFMHGKAAMILYPGYIREVYIKQNKLAEAQCAQLVEDDDLGMMPLYFGNKDESSTGIISFSAWHNAVRKNASPEEKALGKEYIDWLVHSPKARSVFKKMEYVSPYYSAPQDFVPDTALAKQLYAVQKDDTLVAPFASYLFMPGTMDAADEKDFQAQFGRNLYAYAKGKLPWKDVCTNFCEGWKTSSVKEEQQLKKLFC